MLRFCAVLSLIAASIVGSESFAAERIVSFDSIIDVLPDSEIDVRETIVVDSEGANIRRGIFRDFPTQYNRPSGDRVVVGFKVQSVERDGHAEMFRVVSSANGKRIYIGDPDRLLPNGRHSYQIVYRSDRQLGFFDDHDELYWNVTGNGWQLPIERARAHVRLPGKVNLDRLTAEAYTGYAGDTGRDFRAKLSTGGPLIEATRALLPTEGLTIVVGWPKGVVTPPTATMRLRYLMRDDWLAFVTAAGLLSLFTYYLYAWRRVGRDPPARTIVPIYSPPADYSPAAMRYVRQMRYDNKCFAAAVLSLAVKGMLRISEERTGLLGLSKRFTLHKSPQALTSDALPKDELVLLNALLGDRDVLLLEQENSATLRAAHVAHESALGTRYRGSAFRENIRWHLAGLLIALCFGTSAVLIGRYQGVSGAWLFLTLPGWLTIGMFVASVAAIFAFGALLKAPTHSGRDALDQIDGFRMYLGVAEGAALKLIDAPPLSSQLFESYLPAALALDVEQRWAQRFATVFAQQPAAASPTWYSGHTWNSFSHASFASNFSTPFTSAISSASHPPGSSSGSSSSAGGSSAGGSSGGGSSGGGGGGGGGGGW